MVGGQKQNASSRELDGVVVRGIGGDIYGEGCRACRQGLWCSVELRLQLNLFPPRRCRLPVWATPGRLS